MVISRSVILKKRNVSTEAVEEIKPHIFYVQKLFSENLASYEIIWKNMFQPDRPQMTIV